MSFQEKSTWVLLGTYLVTYGWYFIAVSSDLSTTDVGAIDYRLLMLATVIALVVLAVAAHIIIAIASPKDADRTDERDREINRYGEYIGGFVLGAGALVVLAMAMFEVEHFWIANVLLVAMVLSEITSAVSKIVLYRRGAVSW